METLDQVQVCPVTLRGLGHGREVLTTGAVSTSYPLTTATVPSEYQTLLSTRIAVIAEDLGEAAQETGKATPRQSIGRSNILTEQQAYRFARRPNIQRAEGAQYGKFNP